MEHPAIFTDDQWDGYVEHGRELVLRVSGVQFELGDFTIKIMPFAPRDGQDHGVEAFLDAFAPAIGISPNTLRDYRYVAGAWPPDNRVADLPFGVHRLLSAREDRFELIQSTPIDPVTEQPMERWTLDAAARAAERKPRHPVTPTERVNKARDLLAEDDDAVVAVTQIVMRPTVAAQVMADPAARHSLREADRLRPRHVEAYVSPPNIPAPPTFPAPQPSLTPRPAPAPAPARSTQAVQLSPARREVIEILGICTAFYTQMQQRIVRLHVADYDEDAKTSVRETLQKVRAAADWCETAINTGDTTMDEALAQMLNGGRP